MSKLDRNTSRVISTITAVADRTGVDLRKALAEVESVDKFKAALNATITENDRDIVNDLIENPGKPADYQKTILATADRLARLDALRNIKRIGEMEGGPLHRRTARANEAALAEALAILRPHVVAWWGEIADALAAHPEVDVSNAEQAIRAGAHTQWQTIQDAAGNLQAAASLLSNHRASLLVIATPGTADPKADALRVEDWTGRVVAAIRAGWTADPITSPEEVEDREASVHEARAEDAFAAAVASAENTARALDGRPRIA